MTLNISVVTARRIYQCADYRLFDYQTGSISDFDTQKIVLVNTASWTATICFAGVGRTQKVDVGDWLTDIANSIEIDDPFDLLIEKLEEAESWLSELSPPYNNHSFSIGAFVGSDPVYVLISNFERLFEVSLPVASNQLSVFKQRPTKPWVFLSGQTTEVSRNEIKKLKKLARRGVEPQRMYRALESVNRSVASRNTMVSQACFTTHVGITGDSGGYLHGVSLKPFIPKFAIPKDASETIFNLIDQQFGPGKARFRGMSYARFEDTDNFHAIQLREKPNDANTRCAYGAFLQNQKKDRVGAEREYRKAIALDPNHVIAHVNLATLLADKGEIGAAKALYDRTAKLSPTDENFMWSYARFLWVKCNDIIEANEVLEKAITLHPNSGRLLLLHAELDLIRGFSSEALKGFERARDRGADQASVEAGYAQALHLTGASSKECIAAYRVAIALNPDLGGLNLNLAQLLLVEGYIHEAQKYLLEAMRLGLDEDAQLEAQFYLLCHSLADPAEIAKATRRILVNGGRLRWNVQPNIDKVANHSPDKRSLLDNVVQIMKGKKDVALLEQTIEQWSSRQE